MTRTVTIIHPGALGDVLLSLPAIRALRASFPQREFGLMAGGEVGGLLRACGEIEELFPLEGGALAGLLADHVWARSEYAAQALFAWLNRCDLAVCWMADRDGQLASRLGDLGVVRVIAGSPLSPACQAVHQAGRFMETVREAATARDDEGKLNIPDNVLAAATDRMQAIGALEAQRPLVMVHPGSGSPHKCSEPQVLARAVEWLQAHGAAPVLVGGPADDERLAEVSGRCAVSPPVLRGLDLLSAAGMLAQAKLFLGHDSGLTHLAAWLHIPTVALFGPTDSRRWAPRGRHVTVLSGMPCLCRAQGWQVVRQCPDKPCLQVPVERVVLACRQGLQPQRIALRNPQTVDSAPCHAQ